jgi:uncharacterized membrane protein YeaQ/YmgE (transglycosylase-associated protein family)
VFTLPSLALSFVVATIVGLVWYMLFGRGWLQLLVFWLVGLAGFFLGQFIGMLFSFSLFPIGAVNLIEGCIVAVIALAILRVVWNPNSLPPIP